MTGKEFLEKKGIKKDDIVGIKVGNKIFDLLTPLPESVLTELEKAIAENKLDSSNSNVKLIRIDSLDGLDIMRHSCAHALAQSVKRLFPETKLSVGPTTEVGFFYDFYRPQGFSEEDLKKIEEEMKKIKNENLPIRRFELKKEEAIK
ncbi:MAG: threonine--tRNA ligase, partial [Candidatus Calescibacterium sp.]